MTALLIDLDGVVYAGERAVPGAAAALDWASGQGYSRLFLTNTTSQPRSKLVDKLATLGISADAAEIFTPPVAAARWLQQQGLRRPALLVPPATATEFSAFDPLPDHAESGADAVVIGDLGPAWDFARLNRAFRLLMAEPRPRLVALGMTRYWQASDGLRLDTAPFVVALSHASGVEPVVLGKPAIPFYAAALAQLGVSATEAVMIGDDIRTDVAGAQAAGIRALLVRTGKFRVEDLRGPVHPDGVLGSLAELPTWGVRHLPPRG